MAADGRRVAAIAAGPDHCRTVLVADPDIGRLSVVRPAIVGHDEYASCPVPRSVRDSVGRIVVAFVRPPHHPLAHGLPDERPPYLVFVHGGPTFVAIWRGAGRSHSSPAGSSTSSTATRPGADGPTASGWMGNGGGDVADGAAAVRSLIADGLADPARIGIRGGSAGGWTAARLARGRTRAVHGGCHLLPGAGSVDMAWRRHPRLRTRYVDTLIGVRAEHERRYAERSPARHAADIGAPFRVLQGLDETICRPAQVELLLENLRQTIASHEYLTFAGEGHGLRMLSTKVAALTAELRLYTTVFVGAAHGPDGEGL